jgi:hypothetical protein
MVDAGKCSSGELVVKAAILLPVVYKVLPFWKVLRHKETRRKKMVRNVYRYRFHLLGFLSVAEHAATTHYRQ